MKTLFGIIIGIFIIILAFYAITNFNSVILKISSYAKTRIFPAPPKFGIGSYNSSQSNPQRKKIYVEAVNFIDTSSNIVRPEIILTTDLNNKETLDISGYAIVTDRGFLGITTAQKVYKEGGVAPERIVLTSGNRVKIYPGTSGRGNFWLNKCTGYLNNPVLDLNLPKQCPSPDYNLINKVSNDCRNYLYSLGTCGLPAFNLSVAFGDSACRAILDQMSYSGCYNSHKNDADFLSNEIYLWVGSQMNIIDPVHGEIKLINREGTTVDEFAY